jgi:hypothetical protein
MLYSTLRLLQQSEKLRHESEVLFESSRIIKARSMTLVTRSKQVSAEIAAAEAQTMQNTSVYLRRPLSLDLFSPKLGR